MSLSMSNRALLLLALLASGIPAASAGSAPPDSSRPPPMKLLPQTIAEWSAPLEHAPWDPEPPARWWDQSVLHRATGVRNLEQLRPLFEAAQAGEPLTIVGLGSSITHVRPCPRGAGGARRAGAVRRGYPVAGRTRMTRARCARGRSASAATARTPATALAGRRACWR